MTLATVERYEPDRTLTLGGRAVVVGRSMAGPCAARVLADTFAEVVVLERDRLPAEPVGRTGAPQTSHPHALLEAGRATLEDLFPGFGEELLTDGGLLIDSGTDMEYYDQGGFVDNTETRLLTYCASRPLFEHVVRRQLRQIENVRIQSDSQVLGYRTDDDRTAVSGVDFRNEDGDEERSMLP
jgi:2-polyprenyl-6-methoxyphenol hydroxylase-like FAD-dependent oxidoreductase